MPHISDYADDLARRRNAVVSALTLNNDALTEGIRPREVAACKGFVKDKERRRLLSVVLVKGAAAGKGYGERAEVNGAYRAMARCGFFFGPDGVGAREWEGGSVVNNAPGHRG